MTIFAERLDKTLKERKLSRKRLAFNTGIGVKTVEMWFLRDSYPRVESLKTVCEYLNISADYLFGLKDNTNIEVRG